MGPNPPHLTALVAMNGFKGSLTNLQACEAVAAGLRQAGHTALVFPVGDGGAGCMDAVHRRISSEIFELPSTGPLGEKITARGLAVPALDNPEILYFESSQACGHSLVPEKKRDPMRATSYGLGSWMRRAIEKWARPETRVLVGLGDSAISDAGAGMLTAFGFTFEDELGAPLEGNGASLGEIRRIVPPSRSPWESHRFTILCDVFNPLLGAKGSARTFAPQKGASPEQVVQLERGMENIETLWTELTGRSVGREAMTGSAGGLSAAFLACFSAELVHGAQFLLDWLQFDRELEEADFVVTGEGRSDQQTLSGKAPIVCLERAQRAGKKGVILSGSLGKGYTALLKVPNLSGCFESGWEPEPAKALQEKAADVFSDPALMAELASSL